MYESIGTFIMLFFVFGLGVGLLVSFTLIGLMGGLVGLLLFNKKVVMFPNPKVAIFVGYVAFLVAFVILPFFAFLSSYNYYSYQSYSPLIYLLMLFSLPFIQCVISLGFYILLTNRKVFNSNYFGFVAAYFLATLVLSPIFMLVGLFGLSGSFSPAYSSISSLTGLFIKP